MANGRASRDKRESLGDVVREKTKGLRDWRRLWWPAVMALTLLSLGVSVAVMINPATTSPTLPLSDSDIGQVANADVRAPISFTVPDVEATERKRGEAENAVRSVYDFEAELGRDRLQRLKEAFAEMQTIVREYNRSIAALEAAGEEADGGHDQSNDPDEKKKPPRKKGKRVKGREEERREYELRLERERHERAMLERFDGRKDEFLKLLQVVVNDEDFAALKADRFSAEGLQAVSNLVERNMRQMIVSNRELLAADRARGITVRYLRDGVPQRELEVMSFSRILDTEEARDRVVTSAPLELSQVAPAAKGALVRLAKALVGPNMTFSRPETDQRKRDAREHVQALEIRIQKGAKIIRDGDLIEKWHIRVFQEMQKLTEVSNAPQMALGTVLLVMILLGFTVQFSRRNIRKFRTNPRDLALLALLLFVSLVSVKLWYWVFGAVWEQFRLFPLDSYYFAIPFAAGAMLIRFVLNSEMSLAFAAVFSALAGLVMESSIGYAIYCLVGSLVAADAVGKVRQRTSLLKAGAVTGLVNLVLALGLSLYGGNFLSFQTVFSAIFAFSGGILAAVIVTAVAPVIEVIFGYTTDIKLLELANLNHPLLKDLIVQAPGSYHHSIIVGSMVEAAAESINCNPLLARVMAYYHDIGKIKKPAYFSENQRDGVNRHDKLKPSLSASVLRAHVKDGSELARDSRLGQPIVDAIGQHHGTSLMKFFYQKAKDQAGETDTINEDDFRYPGPKPQSREVALVMLADSVEAAAKSISDPSVARLQGLVQNIINRIFVDGQLDECELTLQDLHRIARSFNRVLSGIYHHRPDYPEAATKEREQPAPSSKADAAREEAPGPLGGAKTNGKKDGEEKRQETPDEKQEDIKRLGI